MLLGFSLSAVITSRPNFNKEVTLARTQAEDAPDQADFMAQFNQLGANKTPQPIAWQQAVTAEECKAPAENSQQWLAEPQSSDSVETIRARLSDLQETYQRLPRISRMTSTSIKPAPEALYMRHFEWRIEHIGNRKYPTEARGGGWQARYN